MSRFISNAGYLKQTLMLRVGNKNIKTEKMETKKIVTLL